MIAEEAKDDDLKRLLPCPFCGGGITEFKNNDLTGIGIKYGDPKSVSVRHWCKEAPGPSRMIERVGRDKEQAIDRWNMRYSGNHHAHCHCDQALNCEGC
jgi:hypothetical protein